MCRPPMTMMTALSAPSLAPFLPPSLRVRPSVLSLPFVPPSRISSRASQEVGLLAGEAFEQFVHVSNLSEHPRYVQSASRVCRSQRPPLRPCLSPSLPPSLPHSCVSSIRPCFPPPSLRPSVCPSLPPSLPPSLHPFLPPSVSPSVSPSSLAPSFHLSVPRIRPKIAPSLAPSLPPSLRVRPSVLSLPFVPPSRISSRASSGGWPPCRRSV